MKKILLLILLSAVLLCNSISFGQTVEKKITEENLNELVELPVASILPHGEYELGLRIYPNGGVLHDFSFGVMDRFQGTIFFGGENIIGEGEVNWNPRPGFDARLIILEETLIIPSFAIGISTQGFGRYVESMKRYMIKSRGVYIVASRNYTSPLGEVSVHAGANVSLEKDDQDNDMNFFAGTVLSIRKIGEGVAEYDFGTNDNEDLSFGSIKGKGYLNLGFRLFISDNFKLSFYVKNIFENTKDDRGFGREIKIEYRKSFLKN